MKPCPQNPSNGLAKELIYIFITRQDNLKQRFHITRDKQTRLFFYFSKTKAISMAKDT